MFYTIRMILTWLVWLLLADKKRWRELFPVGIFAGYIGSLVDNITFEVKFWGFPGSSLTRTTVFDDIGINLVFTYLFIQWLPRDRTFKALFRHWFTGSSMALLIEWIHVLTGHITYHNGWNLGWSYLSDWILLTLFYAYYRIFVFKPLPDDPAQE